MINLIFIKRAEMKEKALWIRKSQRIRRWRLCISKTL